MNLVEFDLDFIRSFSSFRLHIFLALENKGEIRIQGEKKTPHAPHGFFPLSFKTFLFFFFFFLFPRIFSANALVAFSVSEKEAEVTKETGRQREEGFKSRKRKGRGLRAGMDFCFPSFSSRKARKNGHAVGFFDCMGCCSLPCLLLLLRLRLLLPVGRVWS